MTALTFTVHGKPATKGSMMPRTVGKGAKRRTVLVESLKASGPWRADVKAAAHAAVAAREGTGEPFATLSGPVCVVVAFTFDRPACDPTRAWPITRSSGDVDKLARNLLDALVDAAIIADDSQVCRLVAAKGHPGEPGFMLAAGAHVEVAPIGGAPC